jgi:hypothetical protein
MFSSYSNHPDYPWDRTSLLLYGKSGRSGKITALSKVEFEEEKNYTLTPHTPLCCKQGSLCFQTSSLLFFSERTISLCLHANELIEEYIIKYEAASEV